MTPRPELAAPTAPANGAPEFPGPKEFPLARVKFIVPVELFTTPAALTPPEAIPVIFIVPGFCKFTPYAVELDPPVTFPVIFMVPVEIFCAAIAKAAEPPVMLPVMFTVPVDEFCIPATALLEFGPAPDPADTLPVTFKVPVEELIAPAATLELPPVQFPVMFRVPVDVFAAATEVPTLPPVQFPTIYPTAGDAAVNCKQLREVVVDLLVTLAVSVTPSLSVKMPVPALLISSQVTSAVMVTV
jgi:hypothetical protein